MPNLRKQNSVIICLGAFCLCYWNLSCTAANNFSKILLLEAHNARQKVDIMGISQTYLQASIQHLSKARTDCPVETMLHRTK